MFWTLDLPWNILLVLWPDSLIRLLQFQHTYPSIPLCFAYKGSYLWLFSEALCLLSRNLNTWYLQPPAATHGQWQTGGKSVKASSGGNLLCVLHSQVPVESGWCWSFTRNCWASSLSKRYFPHCSAGLSWEFFLNNPLTPTVRSPSEEPALGQLHVGGVQAGWSQ